MQEDPLAAQCAAGKASWSGDFHPLLDAWQEKEHGPGSELRKAVRDVCSDPLHQWSALLYTAGRGGDDDAALRLLLLDADPNFANANGWTPLMLAAWTGRGLPVIEALIARGADVNASNQHGQTPLLGACRKGHVSIARALLAARRRLERHHLAAARRLAAAHRRLGQ